VSSSVSKTGPWALTRQMLAAGPARLKIGISKAVFIEAHALRREIIVGLRKQNPGGGAPLRELSPFTVAARRLRGKGGRKVLIRSGEMRNSIDAVVRGEFAFVGIPRGATAQDGRSVVRIAELHEFGSDPIIIPITPKMRRYLGVLFSKIPKSSRPAKKGGGVGAVVVQIPERPFLRPAFSRWKIGVSQRVMARVAQSLGWAK